MRTITKQFEVYDFNELDEKIKEKVLEKEMQTQLDLYCETCLENDMNEEAKELVKNEFGENAEFKRCFYDLSYSQGSGAMIEFDIDLKTLNEKYKIINGDFENSIIEVRKNGFYCHEFSFSVDYSTYDLDEKQEKEFDKLYDLFYEDIVSLNIELKETGYSIIEDENVYKEGALIYLNEQEFLSDGTFFYD